MKRQFVQTGHEPVTDLLLLADFHDLPRLLACGRRHGDHDAVDDPFHAAQIFPEFLPAAQHGNRFGHDHRVVGFHVIKKRHDFITQLGMFLDSLDQPLSRIPGPENHHPFQLEFLRDKLVPQPVDDASFQNDHREDEHHGIKRLQPADEQRLREKADHERHDKTDTRVLYKIFQPDHMENAALWFIRAAQDECDNDNDCKTDHIHCLECRRIRMNPVGGYQPELIAAPEGEHDHAYIGDEDKKPVDVIKDVLEDVTHTLGISFYVFHSAIVTLLLLLAISSLIGITNKNIHYFKFLYIRRIFSLITRIMNCGNSNIYRFHTF